MWVTRIVCHYSAWAALKLMILLSLPSVPVFQGLACNTTPGFKFLRLHYFHMICIYVKSLNKGWRDGSAIKMSIFLCKTFYYMYIHIHVFYYVYILYVYIYYVLYLLS